MGYTVYVHISPSNKYYVGITGQKNINQRWRNGFGYKKNIYFSRAIKKYGWDNFKHEIIKSELTKQEACKLEIDLIKKYNSTNIDHGYNITYGGESSNGFKHTDKTKEIISKANKNKIVLESTKEKMRSWMGTKRYWQYQIKQTEEHRRKNSESNMGYKNHFFGKHHSEETKRKLRDINVGKKYSDNYKQKMSESCKYSIEVYMNDECIGVFKGLKETAKKFNINEKTIRNCIKDNRKSRQGYKFKYIK